MCDVWMDKVRLKDIRCLCFNVPFTSLFDYSSLEEVQKETKCGTKCGLCNPYIENILQNRQSLNFDEKPPDLLCN